MIKVGTYVEDVLVAIESVKVRAKAAMQAGESLKATSLMEDLRALELCLEIESKKLVDELHKMQEAA